MSILIKNVLHNSQRTDLLIENNVFTKIASTIDFPADTIIDGSTKAILPAFYNLHTHAAMSLMKGLGDDKELFSWLSTDIWPTEDKLNTDAIYWGTKLAILEMIKSGTVGFSDMYFNQEQKAIMQAVSEMGVRAAVSFVGIDLFNPEMTKTKIGGFSTFLNMENPNPERIKKAISVHSVYTTSPELMQFAADFAKEHNLMIHIHVSETQKEVNDCLEKYGVTPVMFLAQNNLLNSRTVLAHAVHLTPEDIAIIKEHDVTLCTNPASNLKLSSGIFCLQSLLDERIKITLGTDGSASNNNLSMLEEMKICALSAKISRMRPTDGKAEDIFKIATLNGAKALDFKAGKIAEGYLADCLLADLNNPFLVPAHNLISNMVYAADSSCIDTVICNGKILMQNHYVPNEENIIANAQRIASSLR